MQAKSFYDHLIDEYVDKAPLVVQSITTDAEEVHTYIVSFTSGNTVVDSKMVDYASENNGRLDLMALKDHSEGVGVHTVNAVQADKVLRNFLFKWKETTYVVGRIWEAANRCIRHLQLSVEEDHSLKWNNITYIKYKYLSGFPSINQSIYQIVVCQDTCNDKI